MVIPVIRIACLVISFLGYCGFLRKKEIPMPFVPIIALTSAGSILFLAGILNLLPHTVLLLFAGGLWFAFRQKLWNVRASFSRDDLITLSVFLLISAFFAWRLQGTAPLHYDNFTHWLRIVREVLDTNRFPNFQSEMIIFPSYPTGAAGFAYFICKIIGLQTDDVILFSQAVVIAAALCSMLAFVKQFRGSGIVVFALSCIYCLVANPSADATLLGIVPDIVDISICELLPDSLISILSIASLAIVVFFRQDLYRAAWLSLPVQIFLVSVKSSGLFMILFNTVLLLFYAYQSYAAQKSVRHMQMCRLSAIHCGIPFLVYLLWNRHVAMVFEGGNIAKHSVSLEYYRGVLGGKSVTQIFEILGNFLKRFFSWSNSWLLLIICILAFGVIYLIRKTDSKKASQEALLSFCGIVLAYVFFMMGQALMYLASMDYGEAVRLACYDRYEAVILVYLVGAITIFLLSAISSVPCQKCSRSVRSVAILAMVLVAATQASRVSSLFIKTNPYDGSTRQFLEETKETYQIPDGSRSLIYLDCSEETDCGYSGYLAQYVFWSRDVRIFYAPAEDLSSFQALAEDYDYLIVQNQDPAMEQFLTENNFTPGNTVYLLQTDAQ